MQKYKCKYKDVGVCTKQANFELNLARRAALCSTSTKIQIQKYRYKYKSQNTNRKILIRVHQGSTFELTLVEHAAIHCVVQIQIQIQRKKIPIHF